MLSRSTFLIAAPAAILLAICPAAAQELSGPHIEALAGWSRGDRGAGFPVNRGDGLVYGIAGGYDLRFGNVVVGVTGEVSDVTGSSCRQLDVASQGPNPTALNGKFCGKDGRTLFGGLRVGYAIGDHTLLYATGGYANVRTKDVFNGTLNGSPLDISSHSNLNGIRVGGGLEQSIARHAFIKGEYRYTAYGYDLDANQHQLMTGVGFRF